MSPAFQADSLPSEPLGKPQFCWCHLQRWKELLWAFCDHLATFGGRWVKPLGLGVLMPMCRGQEDRELCCCCCRCQQIGLPAGIQLLIQVLGGPVGLFGQNCRWIDPPLGSWFWSLAWDSQDFIVTSAVDRSVCPGMPLILRRTGMNLGFAATTNPSGSVCQ